MLPQPVLAPFLASTGEPVVLVLGPNRQLVARAVLAPFYVRFPTDSPLYSGPFASNYSGIGRSTPPLWPYGVHRAPWSSIIYAHGTVWVAVNRHGRWVGECDTPPGHRHIRRAKLALWELLVSGDVVRAERIAQGPLRRDDSGVDAAVTILTVSPSRGISP